MGPPLFSFRPDFFVAEAALEAFSWVLAGEVEPFFTPAAAEATASDKRNHAMQQEAEGQSALKAADGLAEARVIEAKGKAMEVAGKGEAEGSKAYYEVDLCGPLALVMGGEDRGVGAKVKERCDELVGIPLHGDVVTSLNVSVATGILLFERIRQEARS